MGQQSFGSHGERCLLAGAAQGYRHTENTFQRQQRLRNRRLSKPQRTRRRSDAAIVFHRNQNAAVVDFQVFAQRYAIGFSDASIAVLNLRRARRKVR